MWYKTCPAAPVSFAGKKHTVGFAGVNNLKSRVFHIINMFVFFFGGNRDRLDLIGAEMPTFLAYGSDVLQNASVSSTSSIGQDAAGQITVISGNQLFPDTYILEFEVDSTLPNGEFDGNTGFIGMKVYETQADYLAGTATYTYTPQNPGQEASIQNSLDGIGDSYVRFNANVLTSSDSGAPSLGTLFVAPGSDVANYTPLTFDRHTDVDYDNSGAIDGGTVEDGNGFFNTLNTSVVCFASGTLIETSRGLTPVESIQMGEMLQTLDNGMQPVIWNGLTRFNRPALVANPMLLPVAIGTANGHRPLKLTRQHRLLDGRGFFVVAKSLPGLRGSRARLAWGIRKISYHHLLLPKHDIIFANGIAAESFYPGPQAVSSLKETARSKLFGILPGLATQSVEDAYGPLARPVATRAPLGDVWRPVGRNELVEPTQYIRPLQEA